MNENSIYKYKVLGYSEIIRNDAFILVSKGDTYTNDFVIIHDKHTEKLSDLIKERDDLEYIIKGDNVKHVLGINNDIILNVTYRTKDRIGIISGYKSKLLVLKKQWMY